MGKKFLTSEQQEEAGILTAEVKARLAQAYANGEAAALEHEAPLKGQTALFNTWEDAVECAKRGGAHGAHGLVLHVSRLRHEHRLQLS